MDGDRQLAGVVVPEVTRDESDPSRESLRERIRVYSFGEFTVIVLLDELESNDFERTA